MKMKKIIAGVVASAMAVGAMAVAASAVTASIPFKDDGNGNWQLFLAGDNKSDEVGDIDFTKVASMDITFSFDDNGGEAWAGGAVVAQSDSLGWGSIGQWENVTGNGKNFEGVQSGVAFHVDMIGSFDASDTYAAITIQNYGIDINIDAITLYDASGAKLLALGGAADTPSTDAPSTDAPSTDADGDTTKPADDKNSPDTGVEGVAVVTGLAIIAAGAVVVAKKRK